jgi:hypothetical protein
VDLVEQPAPAEPVGGTDDWVRVYTGPGRVAEIVESTLRTAGIDVVRLPGENLELFPYAFARGAEHLAFYTLAVAPQDYERRRAEITAAVEAAGGAGEAGADAVAEAEEDYDVRACPKCLLYFHDSYSVCPGCGAELVPAVECLAPGQLEPDRVIVSHGTEAGTKSVAGELRRAGFDAQATAVEDWTVAAVDLPWRELTDRTAEAESVLRGGTAA